VYIIAVKFARSTERDIATKQEAGGSGNATAAAALAGRPAVHDSLC